MLYPAKFQRILSLPCWDIRGQKVGRFFWDTRYKASFWLLVPIPFGRNIWRPWLFHLRWTYQKYLTGFCHCFQTFDADSFMDWIGRLSHGFPSSTVGSISSIEETLVIRTSVCVSVFSTLCLVLPPLVYLLCVWMISVRIHWLVQIELWSLQLATVNAWQIQTKTDDSGSGGCARMSLSTGSE